MFHLSKVVLTGLLFLLPGLAFSSDSVADLDLTNHWAGFLSLGIFVVAYVLVMTEEFTHLRKSKPVILAAGLIWSIIAYVMMTQNLPNVAEEAVRHNILEFSELFFFLLVAMTYINAMEEREVFGALRGWLTSKGFSYVQLFWITGLLAFFISPVADNLTTALLMGAVILAVGANSPKFISLAFINVVVAANAGGAFSPFGDITTLMVWQKGILDFTEFFALFIPSFVNFALPALIMMFFIPKGTPEALIEKIEMRRGAKRIIFLFVATIASAVSMHNFLHMPPVLGMMMGLTYLQFFAYYLKKTGELSYDVGNQGEGVIHSESKAVTFDIFNKIARAEWDTLLFFFGIILAVGGLGTLGYLALASDVMYSQWGATNANIAVGLLSAVVDNIPVMFAVLTMNPDMSSGQWLLVTLTAGVGGSLLSVGSAAGVALMGQSKGQYTFFSHLKWTPAIALGYFASIWVHMQLNAHLFI